MTERQQALVQLLQRSSAPTVRPPVLRYRAIRARARRFIRRCHAVYWATHPEDDGSCWAAYRSRRRPA